MNSIWKAALAVLVSFAAAQAHAETNSVFVSCYPGDGSNIMMEFNTGSKKFSYRYEKGADIREFDSTPTVFGESYSTVSTYISGDQNHIVLSAQIIGGDAVQPTIDTSARLQFTRGDAGLQLTSGSLFHQDRQIDLSMIQAPGVCYVQ